MKHTFVPEPPGFGQLSVEEQILYVQALWDRIVDGGCEISAPESHLRLAEERLADYRANPGRARPAFEVLDRLAPGSE